MSLPPHDYAKKLIEVAESDLKAAEVLLKSWMYQQAVFYLQQALEKAVKAAALELELITPGETRKELDSRSPYEYSSRVSVGCSSRAALSTLALVSLFICLA